MNESYRKVTCGSYFLVKNKSKRYVECYDSLKKLEHHLNKQKYLKCTDFNVKFKQSNYEKKPGLMRYQFFDMALDWHGCESKDRLREMFDDTCN